MQKLWRVKKIWIDVLEFFSSLYVHIDFGDVHKVMMAVLDRVQFGMYPSYMTLAHSFIELQSKSGSIKLVD